MAAGMDPLLSRTQRPAGTRNRRGYGTFAALSPADRRSLQKSRTLPTVRRMREIAAARTTRGALDGLALGAVVLVVVSFVKHRPSLLSYLGTGSVLGAGVALAVTVIAFSWEVPRAEDRRLRQAGICVLFGDLGVCAAALASFHSNQVTYKPVVVIVPFVVVAAVGVLLLASDSLRHRMAPTPSPNRRAESDDDPR
jgi:hypothetical protein